MKKIFIFLLVLFILILAISFTSPFLIKNQFNKKSRELIGRQATLESFAFNPFTCAVTAKNLQVLEEDDSALFAGFRSFYINVNFSKLIIGKFQIEEVTLDSPYVNVINQAGIFNLNDLIPKKDSTLIEEASESNDFEFEILNLRMSKGKVVYYEKDIDHTIIMDDLSFRLPRFAYNSRSANMDIQFIIDESGVLAISNSFFPDESRFISHIKLSNLNINLAEPYAKDYLATNDINGKANCDINLIGEFKEKSQLKINGLAWLTNLEVKDTSSLPLFTADSVGVKMKNIDLFGNRYAINKVMVRNFFLRFDMMDSTNSLLQAFAPVLITDTATTTLQDSLQPETDLYYGIDSFIISGGSIKYRDYSLDNYFEYDIINISALADNISSTSRGAKLSSIGVLNQRGRYDANLIFEPNDPLNFDLNFAVKGFQMQDLSPFSLTYAGHPIFKGELIYSGKTTVKQGIVDSQNKMTIYNLQVGDKASKKVLYEMPLKFAVFLLKDKDGVVNLDLAMDGNMNDPNFKFSPLIWQMIRQNLLKIVAAPGKLLASQFGMNEEDIRYLSFEQLDTTLTEESANTLIKLQEILDNKPGLIIDLDYYSPDDMDIRNIALIKAKTFYIKEKFKPKSQEQLVKKVETTSDNDIHFLTFMRKELEISTAPDDSLAIEWVGAENLLAEYTALQVKRKEAIQQHLSLTDPLYLQHFRFSEQMEPPKFETDKSGFIVNFEME